MILPESFGITQHTLDTLNVEQSVNENRAHLDEMGGVQILAAKLGVNLEQGLTAEQVTVLRNNFGKNTFPESPLHGYFSLLFDAFSDTTLIVLMIAAAVSLIIETIENPSSGWVDGTAIFIAVILVANISAGNDYSKELQFRALEASSQQDERTSVYRDGMVERINPSELVVGDIIVLQAGDMIPADAVMFTTSTVLCNESSLTGEPDDLKKNKDADCFLLSSCLVTDGEECRALVIGIGLNSQWGKIKANLMTEAGNTPLQDKLQLMTTQIGYVGMGAAFGTFTALIISIWARDHGQGVVKGVIHAFILAVTIVVVAIPEGLPLAVTISLAYSTKKMYKDQCFIRVLAACETMGNATNICSDKTGTLTENRMTVVEGWFGDVKLDQSNFSPDNIPERVKRVVLEQICVNRTAYLVSKDADGKDLERAAIIGNKTEGALIEMAKTWGFDYEDVKVAVFDENMDRIFAFNSQKKRSTTVIHRPDGSVRLFCKGASEWLLADCCMYMDASGNCQPMTRAKKEEIDTLITTMAKNSLRTLVLAHKDYTFASELPPNWQETPPDNSQLCLDAVVGIIDPLRPDVKEAVATAQRAGVMVRMVTGDNITTACAIARQCGILTNDGVGIEGPKFRKLTPKQLDALLPKLQVMGRSSPDDKFLLVTRLNGHAVPDGREDWEARHKDKPAATWESDRDRYLPGYREEWEATRPDGGEVVGVTGDGTNDAPALKAADVGLAMGITGTKVAQGASDIVIIDDRFSSIVRAIMWGRSVYDNIRKFLQFQLTVNVVALGLVFIGAVISGTQPLNAVQMLWVNLVMDTFGALALGTEAPTPDLLERKPYKRSASLISRPMMRNILVQAAFQLALLLALLFYGAGWFDVPPIPVCDKYTETNRNSNDLWNARTGVLYKGGLDAPSPVNEPLLGCSAFASPDYCRNDMSYHCYDRTHMIRSSNASDETVAFTFRSLLKYHDRCLECQSMDYTLGSIMFNTFVFCQVFNEFNARKIHDELNMFEGFFKSPMFLFVSLFTIGMQILLIQFGADFVKTSPLSRSQWLITVGLGALSLPLGIAMRFIPIREDPNSFYNMNATVPSTPPHSHGSHSTAGKQGATAESAEVEIQKTPLLRETATDETAV